MYQKDQSILSILSIKSTSHQIFLIALIIWSGLCYSSDKVEDQNFSSYFENAEVEKAYFDHSRNVAKGVYFHFKSNYLPNKEEKQTMVNIAKRFGLNDLRYTEFDDLDLVVWHFEWPYWRFDEEGIAICQQFIGTMENIWEKCGSSTLSAWPAD